MGTNPPLSVPTPDPSGQPDFGGSKKQGIVDRLEIRYLHSVLTGKSPMTDDDNLLYALSDTNGNIASLNRAWGVDPNFHEALSDLTNDDLQVVGSGHRNATQQSCYRKKHKGSMALLMREPGNKDDPNAIMVLMAGPSERGGFIWRHVGYLPAKTAAKLAPHWYETNGIPVLLHATVAPLSVNVFNKVLLLTTKEYPEVKFRDIDYLFHDV